MGPILGCPCFGKLPNGDLLVIHPKPYSIYLRGTIDLEYRMSGFRALRVPELEASQNLSGLRGQSLQTTVDGAAYHSTGHSLG